MHSNLSSEQYNHSLIDVTSFALFLRSHHVLVLGECGVDEAEECIPVRLRSRQTSIYMYAFPSYSLSDLRSGLASSPLKLLRLSWLSLLCLSARWSPLRPARYLLFCNERALTTPRTHRRRSKWSHSHRDVMNLSAHFPQCPLQRRSLESAISAARGILPDVFLSRGREGH